jgi:UDPglucose 6-dehydrogenase
MPGYVHGTGKFLLRECVNTTLSYNPAFVAQGDIMQGYRTGGWFSLVLVGRANDEAGALLTRVYERIAPADRCPAICLMSPESAEIAKVTINSPPPSPLPPRPRAPLYTCPHTPPPLPPAGG